MSWVTGILVYVIIWWMVLFVTLPFGISPQEDPVLGTVASAPAKPRLWLKAGITTVVAALIWAVWWVIDTHELITFR